MSELIDKFNKAFERTDFSSFCRRKKEPGNIFDEPIKVFTNPRGEKFTIMYTNDPEKMLGCGFGIKSSYSPSSSSFKYLPSFVLQDYIGMLYITDGTFCSRTINDVQFVAPNYLARAFVLKCQTSKFILAKMPTYTVNESLYINAFDSIEDRGCGVCHSSTKAPEIHTDVLRISRYSCGDEGLFPNRHIASVDVGYPVRERMEIYQRGWLKSLLEKDNK